MLNFSLKISLFRLYFPLMNSYAVHYLMIVAKLEKGYFLFQ